MPTEHPQLTRVLRSLEDWPQLASEIAPLLRAGDVLTLDGPLGAGKTTFTQALCKTLGVPGRAASPTFALLHEYEGGRLPVAHVDFYRLGPESADSLEDELLPLLDSHLLIAEWADYASFLTPTLAIRIDLKDDDTRHVTLSGPFLERLPHE